MNKRIAAGNVRLKRAYERGAAADGTWIPIGSGRGVRRRMAAIARLAEDLSPSTELRKWYGPDPAR
jgi:uncharacterized protein YeaO (DUF488 family)